MKTSSKEHVKVKTVPDTNYIKVEMVITKGKWLALYHALERYEESPVGNDLRDMLYEQAQANQVELPR